MSRKKLIFTIILCVLIVATLCFIWGNSLISTQNSSNESMGVYVELKPVFDATLGEDVVTHGVFRKLAHVTEFFVLCVEVCLLLINLLGVKKVNVAFGFLICGIVAGVDETIQFFSQRGSSIVDVGIDCIGVAFCCVIFLIIIAVYQSKRKVKEKGVVKKS